jgi:hypothetical protein
MTRGLLGGIGLGLTAALVVAGCGGNVDDRANGDEASGGSPSGERDGGAASGGTGDAGVCVDLFSNMVRPCCPATPPDCQGKPDGYPGFQCTSNENAYCACQCLSNEWACYC